MERNNQASHGEWDDDGRFLCCCCVVCSGMGVKNQRHTKKTGRQKLVIGLRVGSCRNQFPYGELFYAHKTTFSREIGFYRILRGMKISIPWQEGIIKMIGSKLLF